MLEFSSDRKRMSVVVRAAGGGTVGRWLAAMEGRPSAATTTPDGELFLAALRQQESLDFFDYETYGVFDLHPQNQR